MRYSLTLLTILLLLSCMHKKTGEASSDGSESKIITQESLNETPVEYSYFWKGTLNSDSCYMKIVVTDSRAYGEYYYFGAQIERKQLEGVLKGDSLSFSETFYVENENEDEDGETTTVAYIEGIFSAKDGTYTGTWRPTEGDVHKPFLFANYTGANYQEYVYKSDLKNWDNELQQISKLAIYDKNGKEIQLIDNIKVASIYKSIGLRDINFDGYQDIAIMESMSSDGMTFLYWTYNPTSGKYDKSNALDGLEGAHFNYESKRLVRANATNLERLSWIDYEFIDGKFEVVERNTFYRNAGDKPNEQITYYLDPSGEKMSQKSTFTDKEDNILEETTIYYVKDTKAATDEADSEWKEIDRKTSVATESEK